MSYFRRGLGGVQSRPQGGRVARGALGGVQSRPQGGRVSRARDALGAAGTEYGLIGPQAPPPPPPPPPPSRVMQRRGRVGPRWYRAMQGASLGSDAPTGHTLSEPTLSEPQQFRRDILASTRAIQEHERQRIRKEEIRGYLQIAATLSIPLAAAVWRLILGRRRRAAESTSSP